MFAFSFLIKIYTLFSPLQAPISLLERDRMIGEWFYIKPSETIAIFSAEHDKFMKITYVQAANANVRRDHNGGNDKPILIFRPFQTWTMASCILLKAGEELGNTFVSTLAYDCMRLPVAHDSPRSPRKLLTFSFRSTDTTTCSCRT